MVVWLIGLSGSGKTTLGNKLKKYYNTNKINSFILDGDLVRDFYDNDIGYSREDRIANIKRILLSAYVLEQNGIIPIVCNISPFEHLREFAREKLINYNEIYLKKDINIAKDTDIKEVYKNNIAKTPIVGIDIEFEIPLRSNLTIHVDDEDEEKSFFKIINFLEDHNNDFEV